jgi:hypothetical protein
MTRYTQGDEQEHILKALGAIDHADGSLPIIGKGRLLEIGAWDPKTFSNSRALIELGWSAVLFEPSPGPLKALVKEYGNNARVEVVGLPVTEFGFKNGVRPKGNYLQLRVTDDALSTDADNTEHLKKWEGYGFYGNLTTWAVSIEQVFERWGAEGGFDFVSIDTEGSSVDLFRAMIRLGNRPRCVSVEHNDRWEHLRDLADYGRYELVFRSGENVVLKWRGEK